jgi:hypothetical protein
LLFNGANIDKFFETAKYLTDINIRYSDDQDTRRSGVKSLTLI